jgi:hypothetical protein
VGAHAIVITVSDGTASASETITIRVINVNDPPVIEPLSDASLLATAGIPFSFRINASDPDGDTLQFYDDTDLFTIDLYSGLISFTPMEEQKGEYTVRISVKDANSTTTTTLTIVISEPEAPKGSTSDGKKQTPAIGLGPTLSVLALILLAVYWINRKKQV